MTKKVGIYVRLSREDSRSGESVSIENQKLMLVGHVKEMGWELREVYQDDGFSGTNQNRPAFQKMITDVKSGFINTILIKDLSRLGRNYLEVGNLAEVFLPQHGCDLISLNEKLDEMMVFRNWFNEQHSKTTSTKVRMGKRISAQSGKFVGAYAPYGYIKDPANRHKLIIDQNTAPIVRKIFELRAMGVAFKQIAAKLNHDMIIPPREYFYQTIKAAAPRPSAPPLNWSGSTIRDIIKNEAYIGNTVSGKTGTMSYKNQKLVRKDKSDWIRAESTHEPLIDCELWEKVNSFKKYKPSRSIDVNLFAGLLHCPDCGFKLRGQTETRVRKDGSKYVSYMCSTYGRHGKTACTIHGISEKALVRLVADHIHICIQSISCDQARIAEAVSAARDKGSYRESCQNELKAHEKQLVKLDMLIENLYIDKISGLVPDSLFTRQIRKYEQEREERTQALLVMKKRINKTKPPALPVIETIDAEILRLLVEKIIVSESMYIDGQKICNVKIIYNFGMVAGP